MGAAAGRADSSLGYALLGLLHEAPRSGYDLRKIFSTTPLGFFSDSPGTVYPALERLRRRGWIEPTPSPPGARRRREFRLAASGRRALLAWLRRPVTRDDLTRGSDALMLRFAFMSAALRADEIEGFLGAVQAELTVLIADLRRFHRAAASHMPVSGRLAFESGIEGYVTLRRWAIRARDEVRRESREVDL